MKYTLQEHVDAVRAFNEKCSRSLPNKPTMPDPEERELLARLALEEVLELVSGLGFDVHVQEGAGLTDPKLTDDSLILKENGKENLVDIADGAVDSMWTAVTGPLVICGLPVEASIKEVDESNLSKFEEGFYFREDGKMIKSPKYKPADLQKIVDEHSND